MGAYPTEGGMRDVLLAMKEKAAQNVNRLRWAEQIRITPKGYWEPFNKRTIYFVPLGTIADEIGENGTDTVYRFRHRVRIECVLHQYSADEMETALVGTDAQVGLCEMVEDVLSYFTRNWLGLSGLDSGIDPKCVEDEDTYIQIAPEDQSIYFTVGRVIYEPVTVAHSRPTDT